MIAELQVGAAHDLVDVGARLEHQHRVHAFGRGAWARRADDGGFAHAGLSVERLLHVFRKDVQPFRRDDHLLLAAADAQLSCAVDLAHVAGVKPAVPECDARLFRRVEVPARDVLAAHEDLAIVGNLDLDAGDRLADGTLRGVERMVQGDDRRRLGQPIALDDDKTRAVPRRLRARDRAGRRRRQSPRT